MQSESPSPEELEALKKKKESFIDNELPFLKKEKEYEETLAAISEARFKKLRYHLEYGQLASSQLEKKDQPPKEKEGEK